MKRFLLVLPAVAALLVGCNSRQYPSVNPKHVVFDWGITDDTQMFLEYDSLYYLLNPAGRVLDYLYYNGNYTDSYYHADSTRVTIGYTVTDSIFFCMDRLYAVQTNPDILIMTLRADRDSVSKECRLYLKRDLDMEDIYRCGPDSLLKAMLMEGGMIYGHATNAASGSEPVGSQDYTFVINARGFDQAMEMARDLNETHHLEALRARERHNSTHHSPKFPLSRLDSLFHK